MTEDDTPEWRQAAQDRARAIAHPSLNFVLDMSSCGIPGLKTIDCLLTMAVNQANIAPLTRDPAARIRYGGVESPAPDDERRPVSIRAVAASMRLPYETARRHIRRLEGQGVCALSEAGVVVPAAFLSSSAWMQAAKTGHELLCELYVELRSRRLLEPLPPSHYREDDPPIRAAVRLMSDYLLRTGEALVGRSGDLVSALVLLPLVTQAAGPERDRPVTVAALSRRLRMPAETVRRHVAALVADGVCRSGDSGVCLADASLTSPEWAGLLRENAIAVQRLFAGLAERGVVDAWDRAAGLAADRTADIA